MLMRTQAAPLFAAQPFAHQASRVLREAEEAIHSTSLQLLSTLTDQQYADEIVEKYGLRLPQLDRPNHVLDITETKVPMHPGQIGGQMVPGTKFTMKVPYEGDGAIFHWRPSHHDVNYPKANNDGHVLTIEAMAHSFNSLEVEKLFDDVLENVEHWLALMKLDVDRLNAQLLQLALDETKKRRLHLETTKAKVDSLKFNLKKRSDAPQTYKLPSKSKALLPKAVTTKDAEPEYVMDEKDYLEILSICSSMSKVMERSPTVFHKTEEEHIRVHFLVQLNGQYGGEASAETFNGSGHTDILVRHKDKNVFVAECKFWSGYKMHQATVDQLLGYTTWRDTKTALIIFNRQKDFTNVINEAARAMKEHKHFKSGPMKEGDQTRSRYIFRHPNDANRDIIVTLMLFDIPKPAE